MQSETKQRIAILVVGNACSIALVPIPIATNDTDRLAIYLERYPKTYFYEVALADMYGSGVDVNSITPVPYAYRCQSQTSNPTELPEWVFNIDFKPGTIANWQKTAEKQLRAEMHSISATSNTPTLLEDKTDKTTETFYNLRFINDQLYEENNKVIGYKAGQLFEKQGLLFLRQTSFTKDELLRFFLVGKVSNTMEWGKERDYPFPDSFQIVETVETVITHTIKSLCSNEYLRRELNIDPE